MTIIDGKKVSEDIRKKLKDEVKTYMVRPCLGVIQIGNDEASNTYIRAKEKACDSVGMYFKFAKFAEDAKEIEIINKIIEFNNDEYVHGILLQLPIPAKFSKDKLINLIAKNKDVDGLCDINVGKLINNKKCLTPCTPTGIMELLKYYDIQVEGKHVVIVGRSNLVGKPLASMLLNANATVTICHSKTENLKKITQTADILVVAIGQKNFIKASMVKKDAVVIDVGINRLNSKLYGDVDFDSVKEKASYITPVPGGVGPMTVASLLTNVNKSYKNMNTSK